MRTPSPSQCRLDLAPPLADLFIIGVAPVDYSPVLLLMPFGFHLAMDTLPSGNRKRWLQVRLGCVPLSCPFRFRLLHTCLSRPARLYTRGRVRRSSSERQRDFNPPDQRAAQRTLWASPTPGQGRPSVMYSLGPLRSSLPPCPAGSPRFLDRSFPARCPQPPRKARRVRPAASPPVAGFLTFGRRATFHSVTRPNRVRLRSGSRACFPRFHRTDCSAPLRFRYTYERAI
jgi:hypothetical protein